MKIYVCNVATEVGETDHYTCGDHIQVLEEHVGGGFFDIVVTNSYCDLDLPENIEWVVAEPDLNIDYSVYTVDLTDKIRPWRHDSVKLAQAIMDLYQQKTGPLVE